jgi:HD superfamily phosphohydrolase
MKLTRLSHQKAITPIKDSIHDTLRFTAFEREVIDSPYFQRLHFILQNSTTYTAYPANKNSRFIHSLGVASVAGRLLSSALGNSSCDHLKVFLSSLSQIIIAHFIEPQIHPTGLARKEIADKLINAWKKTIYGQSEFRHSPFLAAPKVNNPIGADDVFGHFPALFLIDTIWEAVRICGLIHDVGHLPMSHSFEGGIKKSTRLFDIYEKNENSQKAHNLLVDLIEKTKKEFLADPTSQERESYFSFLQSVLEVSKEGIEKFLQNIELHERRSLIILNHINQDNIFEFEEDVFKYRNLIFKLALLILFASSGDKSIPSGEKPEAKDKSTASCLRVLKSIIAGEIDADRLDYTIRDGHSCGTPIGAFDLTRVLSNAILILDNRDTDNPIYRIAFYIRSLSGIEQFFHQRHEGYKYLIYHRTSSRTEVCLQELLARIIHVCLLVPTSQIAKLFEYYGYIERKSDRIISLLPANKETLIRIDDANLRTLFFEILTMAKKDDDKESDVAPYIQPIRDLLEVVLLREFGNIFDPFKKEGLRGQLRAKLGSELTDEGLQTCIDELFNESIREEYALKLKKAVREEFGDKVTTLVNFQFPKVYQKRAAAAEQIVIIMDNGDLLDIGEVSSSLNNMHKMGKEEFRVKLYFVAAEIKNDTGLRNKLTDFLLNELVMYYTELTNRTSLSSGGKDSSVVSSAATLALEGTRYVP